ncbi:TOBE domain-containing protein [Ramlibacter sp. MMS24-I3-19]|uniref:TOBE domain-containing protein n=1 Tax=Ramlibacter sp. MMS24-I3-19 TaxID=3416606 RepID=UPI003D07A5CC
MPRRPHLAGALGNAAGDKRLDLLRRVDACGSISQAARDAAVSYKAAWQAIDMLSNLAGVPVVEKAVGGAGGGGARLTAAGKQLLQAGAAMARSREQVLARLAARPQSGALAALGLRTSMRNQVPCSVAEVQVHGPLVRVDLVLPDGGRLASRITAESAELLGLVPGLEVLALCKATAVRVERVQGAASRAGTNQLDGRASRISRGDAGDEVAAQVGTLGLVGFAAPRSRLRVGSRVSLQLDEAAVVIALPG